MLGGLTMVGLRWNSPALDCGPGTWAGRNLADADLRNADLRGTVLTKSNLVGACLQGANLFKAVLDNADLRNADLRGAQFLHCPQLQAAQNWETAFRDEDLACGALVPEPDP